MQGCDSTTRGSQCTGPRARSRDQIWLRSSFCPTNDSQLSMLERRGDHLHIEVISIWVEFGVVSVKVPSHSFAPSASSGLVVSFISSVTDSLSDCGKLIQFCLHFGFLHCKTAITCFIHMCTPNTAHTLITQRRLSSMFCMLRY